ncbi:MAG TPA: type II secretion system F family protein [Reyranella sp.]|nr:type II secretion system F family protein [Reyranella sp.]
MNALLIFSLAIGLLVASGGALALGMRQGARSERALDERIGRAVGAPLLATRHVSANASPGRSERIAGLLRWPFEFGLHRPWGITLSAPAAFAIAAAGGGGTWLVLRELMHLPVWSVGAAAAAMALLMPRLLMMQQQRRADARFTEYFPDAIDMVVRMVRSGLSVGVAVRTVGAEAAEPVAQIFKRAADRSEIGVPLEEALSTVSEEIGLADFRFFAVTIALQRTTGGNLARTLETFGEIIRKRRAVRLKAVAATAEVRISAIVLGAIPFVVVGMLSIVNPGYLEPMASDPRGNVLLGSALLFLLLGGLSMRWLIRSGMRT